MANVPFLIARRRNQRSRNGAAWLEGLSSSAGVPIVRAEFLDVEISVRTQEARDGLIELAFSEGRLRRFENVRPGEADALWDEHLACLGEIVVCRLLHHPDFEIVIPGTDMVGCGLRLLMFDGDTVTATSLTVGAGIALDRYADERIQQLDFDVWKEC